MRRALLLLALPAIVSCGLFSDEVKRTDLTEWITLDLPASGFSIKLPKDHFHFQMHWRSHGIGDATWMISVSTEIKAPEEFDDPALPAPSNPLSKDVEYVEWVKWISSYHEEISVRQIGTWHKQFRRDVETLDGQIVSLHVTYYYSDFDDDERREDERAIIRILDSVKAI